MRDAIEAAAAAPATMPDAAALRDPASLVHRHLRFVGRWRRDAVVYLDNRVQDGPPGFFVLMALRVDAPAGAADVVVDRGWLPRDPRDRTRIAPYATPEGPVVVTGVAIDEEPRVLELARDPSRSAGGIWQNFDDDAFAAATGRMPMPIVLRQDRGGVAEDGLARVWPDRGGTLQAQIDRHHGYAAQWFALAAALAGFVLYRAWRIFRQ